MAAKKKTARKRGRPRKVIEPPVTDVLVEVEPPEKVGVLVIGNYPNPVWVKGVDKNGKVYKIRVPKRFSSKLLHKQITVQKLVGELEEYYKYEP